MTRSTLRTSFKVKRSEVMVPGRLTQTHKMCHTFRAVRPNNFKVGVHRRGSAASAMTSKVKGQGHKLTSSVRRISASS